LTEWRHRIRDLIQETLRREQYNNDRAGAAVCSHLSEAITAVEGARPKIE
jgi:hypothetical protein